MGSPAAAVDGTAAASRAAGADRSAAARAVHGAAAACRAAGADWSAAARAVHGAAAACRAAGADWSAAARAVHGAAAACRAAGAGGIAAARERRGVHRAALAAFAMAAVLAGPLAREASGHAGLIRADPAVGAALGATPTAVRLTFSERVEPALSQVRVLDRRGAAQQNGSPGAVPGEPAALQVALRTLPRGVYTVTWRSLSAVDGHATSGSFAFGVGEAPTGPAARTTSTSPGGSGFEMLARFLLIAGLVLLLGAAVAGVAGFAGAAGGELRLAAAGWVLAAIGLAGLLEAQRRSAGASLGELLDSDVGRALVQRALAVAAAGLALALAWRWRVDARPPRRVAFALAAVATATGAAMAAHVAAGHAAAGTWPGAIAVGSQWLHFAAAGVWAGGLASLVLGLRGASSPARAVAVRRFATVALAAIVAVAVAGTLRAIDELGAFGDLWATGYGRAIVAKAALLALIVVIAARRRRAWAAADRERAAGDARPVEDGGPAAGVARPVEDGGPAARTSRAAEDHGPAAPSSRAAEERDPLRRTSRAELLLAAVAIALAAVLGTIAPPAGGDVAAQGLRATGADFATTTRVTLTTASAEPGANSFGARVVDYDSGEPVRGARVRLRFEPLDDPGVAATTLALKPAADGTYQATGANLAFDGRWRATALVQRAADAVEVPLELEVPGPELFVNFERFPGQPPAYTAQIVGVGFVRISPSPERAGPSTLTVGVYTPIQDPATIDEIVVVAAAGRARPQRLPTRRRGRGEFTAPIRLIKGENTIAVVARDAQGTRLRAVFELDVPR